MAARAIRNIYYGGASAGFRQAILAPQISPNMVTWGIIRTIISGTTLVGLSLLRFRHQDGRIRGWVKSHITVTINAEVIRQNKAKTGATFDAESSWATQRARSSTESNVIVTGQYLPKSDIGLKKNCAVLLGYFEGPVRSRALTQSSSVLFAHRPDLFDFRQRLENKRFQVISDG